MDVAYDTTYLEDVPNKGSVLRVKMVNFMTYGNVEFVPGRRLNLILGPNGELAFALVIIPEAGSRLRSMDQLCARIRDFLEGPSLLSRYAIACNNEAKSRI